LGKIRRAGYIFITWIGDHAPKHVHVFKNGKEVMKYDLENKQVMSGRSNRKIEMIILELLKEKEL